MPALPAVPNVVRIDLKQTYSTDADVLTRQFFSYSGAAPTVAQANTFATAVSSAYGTHVAPNAPDEITLVEVTVTDLSSDTAAQGIWTGTVDGSLGASGMGAGTATLVTYTIARRYRGGKPKNFWVLGDSSKLLNPRSWTSAWVTDLEGIFASYQSAILGLDLGTASITSQVNVSYYKGFSVETNPVTGRARNIPVPRDTPVVDNLESIVVSSIPASQRRRNGQKR